MKKRRARELSRNQPILRFDVILQHNWPIEQCLLHIRFFSGGNSEAMFWTFHPSADRTNNEHLRKPFFKVIRKSFYSLIFKLKVEGSIGYAHWICTSLLSRASSENHVILKGKPLPTLSHLHTEYGKAVLQSATALSKYTGNNMNSLLIVVKVTKISKNLL